MKTAISDVLTSEQSRHYRALTERLNFVARKKSRVYIYGWIEDSEGSNRLLHQIAQRVKPQATQTFNNIPYCT
jgi:hypothetical protein